VAFVPVWTVGMDIDACMSVTVIKKEQIKLLVIQRLGNVNVEMDGEDLDVSKTYDVNVVQREPLVETFVTMIVCASLIGMGCTVIHQI